MRRGRGDGPGRAQSRSRNAQPLSRGIALACLWLATLAAVEAAAGGPPSSPPCTWLPPGLANSNATAALLAQAAAACHGAWERGALLLLQQPQAPPPSPPADQTPHCTAGGPDKLPSTAACQACKCPLEAALQHMLASGSPVNATPPCAAAHAVAQLWSALPGRAVNVSWAAGCSWGTLAACGARDAPASSPARTPARRAALAGTSDVQWSALCACPSVPDAGSSSSKAVCSASRGGQELRVWPSRCHAKCMVRRSLGKGDAQDLKACCCTS